MRRAWLPDEHSGLSIHIPALLVPLIGIVIAAAAIWALSVLQRNRALEVQTARLVGTAHQNEGHERALQALVAQQKQRLDEREAELEMLRRHIQMVEMQLDGLDALSRETRASLGLPESAGTWSGGTGAETPQGGPPAPAAAGDEYARLDLVQRRLAAGVGDMYRTATEARARKQAADSAQAAEPNPAQIPVGEPANWPARGDVTSPFGWREFRGQSDFHTGIDVALAYGTAVLATGHGLVVGSGWQPGYGWCVLVAHGGGYHTLYAHLSATGVEVGDTTGPGETVGYSGSSGNSTGPHLHYEIWKDAQPTDPRPFMDGTGPG